jgi:hypothetical protein
MGVKSIAQSIASYAAGVTIPASRVAASSPQPEESVESPSRAANAWGFCR